ncbi:MAG: hypothetical protein N3E45_00550 [Oscillatoriaceae bacterium SKW80]|nr:hypothetical protein [Oscillatoriaceae bacterium SKYG93]MCX8119318.1 hypothetical protein [Oscillatoriaceae bacterium SKW80]MDW8454785.1 hypothetical protein [Oscillatoriaceae cyanobacterium SKYGB_i_bin93]HIK28434.1 hypothetical protein [Oscillatoriaceae cyanobacterium M7585_C2015_266]
MQEKQKVTLYLPPELHRKLKIRAAIDSEPMSTIAEKAIVFYLTYSEIVDEVESAYGKTHRVYNCPECNRSVVLREGELVALRNQPGVLTQEGLSVERVPTITSSQNQEGEEELVPC